MSRCAAIRKSHLDLARKLKTTENDLQEEKEIPYSRTLNELRKLNPRKGLFVPQKPRG